MTRDELLEELRIIVTDMYPEDVDLSNDDVQNITVEVLGHLAHVQIPEDEEEEEGEEEM